MIDCQEAFQRFKLHPQLVGALLEVEQDFRMRTGREIHVISGYRTPEKQRQLESEGRPTAPYELSNHGVCPSRAADIRIEGFPTRALKIAFGEVATINGLRWGGGSPLVDGIPSDWNHVDLGPRMDRVAQEYRGRNR